MVSASPLTRSSHHAGEDFRAAARPRATHARADAMPQFSTTRRVRHSAADMFDLSPTSSAIPNSCRCADRSRCASAFREPEGVEILVADMTVAYKFVHESFTSRVTLDRPNLQILVEYLEGPFSKLENRWTFHSDRRADLRGRVFHFL